MLKVELTGEIVNIFPGEIMGNNYEKRICWVKETSGKYPNVYSLEMVQGAGNVLDEFRPGEIARFNIEVRGVLFRPARKMFLTVFVA